MTTYYVDPVNGSNSNNGLGPDATTGNTNKPWATIAKALGGTGVAAGDTVYLAPGTYREVVTLSQAYGSLVTMTADPANSRGFKTSAGVLVAPGPVEWSAYTTNDKTAPSGSDNMWCNGVLNLTVNGITFISGSGKNVVISAGSHDITFNDCTFIRGHNGGGQFCVQITSTFGVAQNVTIDRCRFLTAHNSDGSCVNITLPTGVGADYDSNITIKNSVMITHGSGMCVQVLATGSSANKGGGVRVRNCTITGRAMQTTGTTTLSTSIPCLINNCFVYCGGAGSAIASSTTGLLTEDYNIICASTPRGNVTAGTHSISDGSYSPRVHIGQESQWGMNLRPFMEPSDSSPLLGFGNDGSQSSYDGMNRPRPAGGASASPAVGYLGRGNTAVYQTATVHGSATTGISLTGPGYQDFDVEVDAVAQSIAVYMQFDSTYDTTNGKPKIEVLANAECGVTAASSQMTAAANTWEQRTLSFTPTAKGIVTIRISSLDNNGGGKVYASDKSGW